jgi:hypothetical protein
MTISQVAFWLFAAIACGGLLLASLLALRVRFPRFMGTAHGIGGLLALAVLFAANLRGEEATPAQAWWALVVLLGGFVGGMALFRIIFRDKATLPLVAVHASVAAAGLYLLYHAAF